MLTEPNDLTPGDLFHDSTILAVSVLTDTLKNLPDDDRDDLLELFKAISAAKKQGDQEGLQSAMLAMHEILEQSPSSVTRVAPLSDPAQSIGQWVTWISGKIRHLRKEAGMTQEKLSQLAGLPQSHISRLERGEHSPSASTLKRLADAFSIPLKELDPSAADEAGRH